MIFLIVTLPGVTRSVGRRGLPMADLALAGALAVFAGLDVVLSPN
jgi:hypothetical protein